MGIGKVNAYATLDKTENYIGDAIQYGQEKSFRDRQFRQENEDKVKAQKALQAKALQDESNAVKMPDLKTVTSLNSNLEKLKYKTAFDIQENYNSIGREIENTNDKAKIADLKAKQGQLKLGFDTLNDFSTKVNESMKYLMEHKDEIDPDSYDEQMAKYSMAGKGYGNIRFDENMHPNFDSTDENGNVLKEGENKSLADFFTNNAKNLMLKSTFNDDVDKVVDKIGKVESKNENGQTISTRISPTKEAIATAKETLFKELLNKKNNVYRVAKDNGIKPDDVDALREIVNKTIDSKLNVTTKNEINTSELSRIDRKNKDARDEAKDDQSFTTTPEIPLNFNKAGVVQGRNLVMNIENGKAKPSLSFTNKNGGKVLNFTNVIPQKVSRILKNGKYVYVTEISHLKPTKIYAEGGEDVGGGQIAKKGDYLGVSDIQTSEVVTLREANALSLLKSKTIKSKEDLRNVFPKEEVKSTDVKKETPKERALRLARQ